MNSGAKPRLSWTPFQVASWLPISRIITPLLEPTAYAATGMSDSRCGAPKWCAAAQRLSEVQVVTGGVGAGFGTTADGMLV